MKRFILFILGFILLISNGISQDTNSIKLHLKIVDRGICLPMLKSIYYPTSRYREAKSVLQSGSYYSTVYAYVNSKDSGNLNPQSNHQFQSSSLQFNPDLDYELVILRSDGFNRNKPDSMIIKISELRQDAQLIIPFKKGKFKLNKMKFFKTIGKNSLPDFQKTKNKELTNGLKLDSTAYYKNGKKKAKYYRFSDNFPLYFVKEFDSLISGTYSQGFRLISNYKINQIGYNPSINSNPDVTKYGYWEYFVDEEKVKHELWASMLQEQFEWYPSGQLKFKAEFASYNKQKCHYKYLENGDIKEEFLSQTTKRISVIRSYNYSSSGKLILINTYSSSNGIIKKELLKRELFYPSGKLKMAENFVGTYTIKYYKEDGAERN